MDGNCKQSNVEKPRVILFPLPVFGHINPMFHLAAALHSKGISITIIHTKHNAPNPSNFPLDYTFHLIDDGLASAEPRPTSPPAVLAALNINCEKPFKECLASLLGSTNERYACLITDAFWRFARPVCEEFKLPRLVNFVCILADLVSLCRYDESKQNEDYSSIPEVLALPNEIKTCSGLICNSFEELESSSITSLREDFPQLPIFPIGPLHKYSSASVTSFLVEDQDKHSIISWLDNQEPNSVLYASFGSLVTINETEFTELAWGLAKSNQPFLWVNRGGLVRGTNGSHPLPDGFIDAVKNRGLVVKWAPQQQVLSHNAVGGFLTQGGWNSTLETISEGVPLICMPGFLSDQKVVAKHVCDVWRIGLRLDRSVGGGEIADTINKLMASKEGEEARERVTSLKNVVNHCIAEGGSSYDSLDKLCSFISSL